MYPTRELYEDEFNKIWQAQSQHYPELMTAEARQRVHQAIFRQRPLKPQRRGKCTYLPSEDRTFRATPSFQRYRILQEVNSLEWWDGYQNKRVRDYPDARDEIVRLLERVATKSGQVTFGKMRGVLKRLNYAEGDFRFNFETQKRKGFDGNLTSNLMQHEDCIGEDWHAWLLGKQDEFIDVLLNGTPDQQERDRKRLSGAGHLAPPDGARDDADLRTYIRERFELSEFVADNCLKAQLKDDSAHISSKAAQLMLAKMQDGIVDPDTGEFSLPLQSDAAACVAWKLLNSWILFARRVMMGSTNCWTSFPTMEKHFAMGGTSFPGLEERKMTIRPDGVASPTQRCISR